jgi:hypothetical protein
MKRIKIAAAGAPPELKAPAALELPPKGGAVARGPGGCAGAAGREAARAFAAVLATPPGPPGNDQRPPASESNWPALGAITVGLGHWRSFGEELAGLTVGPPGVSGTPPSGAELGVSGTPVSGADVVDVREAALVLTGAGTEVKGVLVCAVEATPPPLRSLTTSKLGLLGPRALAGPLLGVA